MNDWCNTQPSIAGSFSAAKYTPLHSSLVIFLMAPVHSCCKVSPGQILSLPHSSTALIPLASGHSQACRKKSPPHHWRHADTPLLAAKINCSPSPCIVSPSVSLSGERVASLCSHASPVCYLKWVQMKRRLMLKLSVVLKQLKGDFVF